MARIHPFRAWRYNQQKVSLARVVTQPYDKITPAMQERYHAADPHNLVRIILGLGQADDDQHSNAYTRAAAHFQDWRSHGVLTQDPEPSLYLYKQRFTSPGTNRVLERVGFIGLGTLHEYDENVVFRHEQTLAKPKADRLDLLRATRAHFGQLFMLYSDAERRVESALSPSGAPAAELKDEYGVEHQVWRVPDPGAIAAVQDAMADKQLIIADGHHRYETALTYRNQQRELNAASYSPPMDSGGGTVLTQQRVAVSSGEKAYDRVMMTFVNMDSEGLVILPTHRVVFGLAGFDQDLMLRSAWGYFEIEKAPRETEALIAKLAEAGAQRTAIAAVTAGDAFLLRWRPGASDSVLAGISHRQRQLDVVQLHKVLLEHVLGISEADVRDQSHVTYHRDAADAIERVRHGANVAFLMNSVGVKQVQEIALAGEVLPQKSTDFYPKLLSGLTIYALD